MTGTFAVADHSTGTITIIGSAGRWMVQWSDRGTNPGQLSLPLAVDWLADDRVAVFDPINARMLFLAPDARLIGERRVESARGQRWREIGTSLMEADLLTGRDAPIPNDTATKPPRQRNYHIILGRDYWTSIDTLLTAPVSVSWNDGTTPLPGTAIPVASPLGDSLVVVAGDIPELRIRILDRTGAVTRQICRVALPLPLSPAESTVAKELGEVEPTASMARVGRLFTSADGRIWAQRNRATGSLLANHWFGPLGATFDVFAPDGEYLGEVIAPRDARLVAAHGDIVMGLRYRDTGAVSVVAYMIRHER